jgi:phosphoglycerol transferase MdoB-like AlkP superfamily enzyme
MMAVGLLFDIVTALNLFALFALYLVVIPRRIYDGRWHRWLLAGACSFVIFGLIYLGAVEYFFFDEFNSRFNFVAVEYLIYPHEVFVNIWQSYPVARVMLAALALTAAAVWVMRNSLFGERKPSGSLGIRFATLAILSMAIGLALLNLNLNTARYSGNRVVNELAMNGIYAFFSAALNNEMDYGSYYLSLPDEEADERLRKLMTTRHSTYFPETDHIERHVVADGPPQVSERGRSAGRIPGCRVCRRLWRSTRFDACARSPGREGMLFTRAYATGTRTVRGMEAVTASFPPVPAESIVKRPHNEGMFNWSTVMAKNGYTPTFIYGGYGTFDNMNYFFRSNGYRVIDRTDMDDSQFANIWGVSDEDLFRNAGERVRPAT